MRLVGMFITSLGLRWDRFTEGRNRAIRQMNKWQNHQLWEGGTELLLEELVIAILFAFSWQSIDC